MFRFRSASFKHRQTLNVFERQLKVGFDCITYQFGHRFAFSTLQGRMVMLYHLDRSKATSVSKKKKS